MPADIDNTNFPGPIIDVLAAEVLNLPEITQVVKRPFNDTDPNGVASVYSFAWQPVPESNQTGSFEPVMGRYIVNNDYMLKTTDAEEGSRDHAALAKIVRVMLYRNAALDVALRQLSETSEGITERVMRFGVTEQKYLGDQIGTRFVYISNTALWVETAIEG